MAAEALSNLILNVPGWQEKLQRLSDGIDQRQAHLAAVETAENGGKPPAPPVLRNRGSTESLRPRDGDAEPETLAVENASPEAVDTRQVDTKQPAQPSPSPTQPQVQPQTEPPVPTPLPPKEQETTTPSTPQKPPAKAPSPSPLAQPRSPAQQPHFFVHKRITSSVTTIESEASKNVDPAQQQSTDAISVAQARARRQVRKHHKAHSITSVKGDPGAYQYRSMIIVYYDSYVQSFFEELVKFLSASRNLMRKAKMAAKVAHIKRTAQQDDSDSDDGGVEVDDDQGSALAVKDKLNNADPMNIDSQALDNDNPGAVPSPLLAPPGQTDHLPSVRYMKSQNLSSEPTTAPSSAAKLKVPPAKVSDAEGAAQVLEDLDRLLETMQGRCETAAHNFLRDGKCTKDIRVLNEQLNEAHDKSARELKRIRVSEPELLAEDTGDVKVRTHRPPTMRREAEKPPQSLPVATALFERYKLKANLPQLASTTADHRDGDRVKTGADKNAHDNDDDDDDDDDDAISFRSESSDEEFGSGGFTGPIPAAKPSGRPPVASSSVFGHGRAPGSPLELMKKARASQGNSPKSPIPAVSNKSIIPPASTIPPVKNSMDVDGKDDDDDSTGAPFEADDAMDDAASGLKVGDDDDDDDDDGHPFVASPAMAAMMRSGRVPPKLSNLQP